MKEPHFILCVCGFVPLTILYGIIMRWFCLFVVVDGYYYGNMCLFVDDVGTFLLSIVCINVVALSGQFSRPEKKLLSQFYLIWFRYEFVLTCFVCF